MSEAGVEVAVIAARAGAATPGPWAVLWNQEIVTDHQHQAVDGHMPSGGYRFGHHIARVEEDDRDDNEPGAAPASEDAAFIAAARTDVPRLTAALGAVLALCDGADLQDGQDAGRPTDGVLRSSEIRAALTEALAAETQR